MAKILAADIGATNSRFAFFTLDETNNLELNETQWLDTGESSSFKDLIENLKSGGFSLKPEDADLIVIAIAGPVENSVRSSPPFISWDIDITDHACPWYKKTVLINDFVAQAFACRSRIGENAVIIKQGDIVRGAVSAVVGAGTALGKAALVPDHKGGYIAVTSEGGHAAFPFESLEEQKFQRFLLENLSDSYITLNRLVSGKGLCYIHQFLTGMKSEPHEIADSISNYDETLEWASRFYGRACRNYALEVLALGGVYITGGVAARTPRLVTHRAFRDEFNRSDTLAELLNRIPVFLIMDQNAGLWGAAFSGLQRLKKV